MTAVDRPRTAEHRGITSYTLALNYLPLTQLLVGAGVVASQASSTGRDHRVVGGVAAAAAAARVPIDVADVRHAARTRAQQDARAYKVWWFVQQWQVVFNRLPWIEELMRLVPGLYALWIFLWGGRVSPLVYWAPGALVIDRPLVIVEAGAVIGTGAGLAGHAGTLAPDGSYRIDIAAPRVGRGRHVGARSGLGPGAELAPGTLLPAGRMLKPFTAWDGSARRSVAAGATEATAMADGRGRHRSRSRLNIVIAVGAIAIATGCLWLASHAAHWSLVVVAAFVFSFANNTIFSLLHECVHGTFSPATPDQRKRRRAVRGVLPDRVHDPAHQPFRASSAQPHRLRALRLLSAAPVALAEDLLDLLPADRVLLGDHSGRRLRLPGLAVRVPQPRVPGRPGEMVGLHRIRARHRERADREGMAAGAVHVRLAGVAVVEPRARLDRLARLLLGVRAELELAAIYRSRLEPARRARGRLEPAVLAADPGDLPQLQPASRASPPARHSMAASAALRAGG